MWQNYSIGVHCVAISLVQSYSEWFQVRISKSQVLRSPFPDLWHILQPVTLIAQLRVGQQC